jgi:hypothetical protein
MMITPVAAALAEPTSAHLSDRRFLCTSCISIPWPPVSPPPPSHPSFLGIIGVRQASPASLFRLPSADHP